MKHHHYLLFGNNAVPLGPIKFGVYKQMQIRIKWEDLRRTYFSVVKALDSKFSIQQVRFGLISLHQTVYEHESS